MSHPIQKEQSWLGQVIPAARQAWGLCARSVGTEIESLPVPRARVLRRWGGRGGARGWLTLQPQVATHCARSVQASDPWLTSKMWVVTTLLNFKDSTRCQLLPLASCLHSLPAKLASAETYRVSWLRTPQAPACELQPRGWRPRPAQSAPLGFRDQDPQDSRTTEGPSLAEACLVGYKPGWGLALHRTTPLLFTQAKERKIIAQETVTSPGKPVVSHRSPPNP